MLKRSEQPRHARWLCPFLSGLRFWLKLEGGESHEYIGA